MVKPGAGLVNVATGGVGRAVLGVNPAGGSVPQARGVERVAQLHHALGVELAPALIEDGVESH